MLFFNIEGFFCVATLLRFKIICFFVSKFFSLTIWVKIKVKILNEAPDNKNKEVIMPYSIEDPYIFNTEQTYYAVKDKVYEGTRKM